MTRHTRGEWGLYNTKSDHVVYCPSRQGGLVIARVPLRYKEDEANAYLLAQASNMKQALIDLLTWYDEPVGDVKPLIEATRAVLKASEMPTWADEFPGFGGREAR